MQAEVPKEHPGTRNIDHLYTLQQPIHLSGHFSLPILCRCQPPKKSITSLHPDTKPAKCLTRFCLLQLCDDESRV
ncbi:hypothetical protein MRB53_010058 [Persea americana]|uniref:Uncharacterized protein n=1 Tax=Persea americana TaxID=3435 RepID=A0ACC2LQU7_PERAE|nr:hypothetical protein MRB53_010058 [Persea americana]